MGSHLERCTGTSVAGESGMRDGEWILMLTKLSFTLEALGSCWRSLSRGTSDKSILANVWRVV